MWLAEYTATALTLSDSSRQRLQCPRKYELGKLYGHARNLSVGDEDSYAADVGNAMHRAWQTWIATHDKDRAVESLIAHYPWHLQRNGNDDRSAEACYSTLDALIHHPLDARYQVAEVAVGGEQRKAIEVPFRIELKGIDLCNDSGATLPIYFVGFIDAIMFDTASEQFSAWDLKTTRDDKPDYTLKFLRDPQCLPYGYVLEAALGQAPSTLNVSYLIARIDALAPRIVHYSFRKNAYDIAEWAFLIRRDILAIREYIALGLFPRNGKECFKYAPCPYDDICDCRVPSDTRIWLDQRFGVQPQTQPHYTAAETDPWFNITLEINDE